MARAKLPDENFYRTRLLLFDILREIGPRNMDMDLHERLYIKIQKGRFFRGVDT